MFFQELILSANEREIRLSDVKKWKVLHKFREEVALLAAQMVSLSNDEFRRRFGDLFCETDAQFKMIDASFCQSAGHPQDVPSQALG